LSTDTEARQQVNPAVLSECEGRQLLALGVFHCGAQNFDAIGGTADIDRPPAPIASDENDPERSLGQPDSWRGGPGSNKISWAWIMGTDSMRRRDFMKAIVGSASASLLPTRVQYVTGSSLLLTGHAASTQEFKGPTVGVILQGGPWYAVLDGLRDGLKQLSFVEGKQFVLDIRDTQGDLKAVEGAANTLERRKVNLIYTVATSVSWLRSARPRISPSSL
jgi:hypothetical protein